MYHHSWVVEGWTVSIDGMNSEKNSPLSFVDTGDWKVALPREVGNRPYGLIGAAIAPLSATSLMIYGGSVVVRKPGFMTVYILDVTNRLIPRNPLYLRRPSVAEQDRPGNEIVNPGLTVAVQSQTLRENSIFVKIFDDVTKSMVIVRTTSNDNSQSISEKIAAKIMRTGLLVVQVAPGREIPLSDEALALAQDSLLRKATRALTITAL
jgi:hypothetical protein